MSRRFHRAFALTLIGVAASTMASPEWSGYIKTYNILQAPLETTFFDLPRTAISQNTLRLRLDEPSATMAWQVHYEISPVLTSRRLPLGSEPGHVGGAYRLSDPASEIGGERSNKTRWYQNLDRLNVQFRFDHGDLTIGRQAITLGSARIINPTDVFVPFDVRTFNTEYRNGIDAIRYQRPLGLLGELDVGLVLGEDMDDDNSAAFVQARGNLSGHDLQLVAMRFAGENLLGAGVQSAIGPVGFWLEVAAVNGIEDYRRASTGFDYAFGEFTFGQIEYHFNGAGASRPQDYLTNRNTLAYQRGGVFLAARHYLIPSISQQVSPLISLSGLAIINLDDHSSYLSLSAQFDAGDNLYFDAGIYLFNGDPPALVPPATMIGSEYGGNPDLAFLALRYYF